MADAATQTPSATEVTQHRVLAAQLRIHKAHDAVKNDQTNAPSVLAAAQAVKKAEDHQARCIAEVKRCR